ASVSIHVIGKRLFSYQPCMFLFPVQRYRGHEWCTYQCNEHMFLTMLLRVYHNVHSPPEPIISRSNSAPADIKRPRDEEPGGGEGTSNGSGGEGGIDGEGGFVTGH
ncbi:hypothetical protein Agub_g3938, partial [Astrephomene gubernaculifera]